jgi:peptide/nickel transport system permease protein
MRYHRVRSPALIRAAARTLLLYWCVLSLTFALLRLAPGDPATFLLAPGASAADAARLRSELGLDRPIAVQYARWLGAMLRGDLGSSFVERRSVAATLADALPVSLALGTASLLLSFAAGITIGVVQAARRGALADRLLTGLSVILAASPAYWLGLGAIACFTYLASSLSMPMWMRLPAVGMTTPGADLHGVAHLADLARHSILPVTLLAAIGAAASRGTSARARSTPSAPTGCARPRAKGLAEHAVMRRHPARQPACADRDAVRVVAAGHGRGLGVRRDDLRLAGDGPAHGHVDRRARLSRRARVRGGVRGRRHRRQPRRRVAAAVGGSARRA